MIIKVLCRPCAERLSETVDLTRIITGAEKDTCAECHRRRYTNKYRVREKTSNETAS